jgi:hypothetical protein
MEIDLKKLLEFLDEYHPENKGQASAVIGVIGEDLNASLFKHCMEARGFFVNVAYYGVTTGSKRGPRLDRWIYIEKDSKKTLYQTEIKNWSSWAIGGYKLSVDADDEDMQKVLSHTWTRQMEIDFVKDKYPNHITKVMVSMRIPAEYDTMKGEVEPLLIYWMPINNNLNPAEPLFSVPRSELPGIGDTEFNELNFFSASLYARQLWKQGEKFVDLEMPNAEKRIEVIKTLIR